MSNTRRCIVNAALLVMACLILMSCGGSGGGTPGGGGTTGSASGVSYIDLGSGFYPIGVDNSGNVVGYTSAGVGLNTYYIYSGGTRHAFPPLPNGGVPTVVAMNLSGTVVFTSKVAGSASDSFIYQNGAYTLLKRQMVNGAISQATAISSNNYVVGTGGVIWKTPSTPALLGVSTPFTPLGVNSSGDVVGVAGLPGSQSEYYLIQNGSAIDLQAAATLALELAGVYDIAWIDDSGHIVLQAGSQILYRGTGGARQGPAGYIYGPLNSGGLLPGTTAGYAGQTGFGGAPVGAFIVNTSTNTLVNVNSFVKDKSVNFYLASGVNDKNQMTGWFVKGGNAQDIHGFLAVVPSGTGTGGPVSVTVNPPTTTLEGGGNVKLGAQVSGTTNSAVTWSVVESNGGSVTTAGVYTAPIQSGTFHVKAVSSADPTKSATAAITVLSISGSGLPSYATPVAISGPASGFTINQAIADGEMVGATKVTSPAYPQALYWPSPVSSPAVLPMGSFLGATATGLASVGGNLVIVGSGYIHLSQGDFVNAIYWTSPSAAPTVMPALKNYNFGVSTWAAVNAAGNVVFGNESLASVNASQTLYLSSSQQTTERISDAGAIAYLGPLGYLYLNGSTKPTDLPGNSLKAGTTASDMSANGTVCGFENTGYQYSGIYWTPVDDYTKHVLPSTPLSTATLATGTGANGWITGSTQYQDGSSGLPVWNTFTTVGDLRSLIPQGTGWTLNQGMFVLGDKSVIGTGQAPGSSTAELIYIKAS